MVNTLTTEAQVLLAMGENAGTTQITSGNIDIWILMAESDMEMEARGIGLVANYGSIKATYKQWLANVASHRAAFYGINQNQNSWQLATAQSKLNVCDAIWKEGKKNLNDYDVTSKMGIG